ncbi:MAG: porin family protein [Afipia sp.]|nr:porin family protein [Afipia sp.]
MSTVSASAQSRSSLAFNRAPMATTATWTGWYGGFNGGAIADLGSQISASGTVTSFTGFPATGTALGQSIPSREDPGAGALFGVQFGYNYQFSPKYVVGFEADLQAVSSLDTSGTASALVAGGGGAGFTTTVSTSRQYDYLGTLRARLGVTYTPTTLFYVTGGLAYGGVNSSTSVVSTPFVAGIVPPRTGPNVFGGSFSGTRVGYAIGTGGEWMLMRNWSVKAEYLYVDLGTVSYATGTQGFDVGPSNFPSFGTASVNTSSSVRLADHIFRFGANYHFYGP